MTELNQYYPTTIDVAELKNIDFRPHEIRDEIIKDLERYDSLMEVEFKVIDATKK